jgi:hypothetical protein
MYLQQGFSEDSVDVEAVAPGSAAVAVEELSRDSEYNGAQNFCHTRRWYVSNYTEEVTTEDWDSPHWEI